jgi:hypothetical protein
LKKYEVLADFIDKNTGKYYKIGTLYPAPNAKRANELISKGFLKGTETPDGENDESSKLE